jgi:hypothetical protein
MDTYSGYSPIFFTCKFLPSGQGPEPEPWPGCRSKTPAVSPRARAASGGEPWWQRQMPSSIWTWACVSAVVCAECWAADNRDSTQCQCNAPGPDSEPGPVRSAVTVNIRDPWPGGPGPDARVPTDNLT